MQHDYEVEIEAASPQLSSGEGPMFSAYETPETRIPRLAGAYGFARATVKQMSTRYQNAFEGSVVSLHDHKGTLEIVWRDRVSRMIFEGVVAGAWENSGEHIVLHKLAGGE